MEISVARTGVEVFCLGETVAVPLFKVLREGCTVPAARRTLDRVLRDEVRHRIRLGLLGHLLDFRPRLAFGALGVSYAIVPRIRQSYAQVGEHLVDISGQDRSGFDDGARYRQVLARACRATTSACKASASNAGGVEALTVRARSRHQNVERARAIRSRADHRRAKATPSAYRSVRGRPARG